jgi:P-type Ca2+ transporter type 2C
MQTSTRAGRKCSALSIVHAAIPGRVRFRDPRLRGDFRFADVVSAELARRPGILSAAADATTGSLLVHYREPLSLKGVAGAAERALTKRGTSRRAPEPAPHPPSSAAQPAAQNGAQAWHAKPAASVLEELDSAAEAGLSAAEATRRLEEFGHNVLSRAAPRSGLAIFADQMTSLPIALLTGSAALSAASGAALDAGAIMAAVLLNSGIATATERGAERTILGLSRYDPEPSTVLRDASAIRVNPADLVPGDVVLLAQGAMVPADARLIRARDLSVNESALTGESLPAQKNAELALPEDLPLAERATMVFRGTAVTGGHAAAVVVATGEQTEIGRIQALLGSVRPPETPIQRQLDDVGRTLVAISAAACGAMFGFGVLRGQGAFAMLRSAISLAVAAIPEGLPAVATTTLALGIRELGGRGVLVRKLEAVETLGAVEIVGLDKTGTLTANRMAVEAVQYDDRAFDFPPGEGEPDARLKALLGAAVLSSEATVAGGPDGRTLSGTSTECALLQAALDIGMDVEALRRRYPLLVMVPRSESRKRIASLHADGQSRRLCVKGDPIEVLACCTSRATEAGPVPLDDAAREDVRLANDKMAARALRVLGVAMRREGGDPEDERDLLWLGLVGMADPLRPGMREAIRTLHDAGIRTVMITGDQSLTASAIARALDLANGGEVRILEAGQIRDVSPDVLSALASQVQVFARISPVNKLQIVRALQASGRIVAMTGDGINDGPALRAADIGIAMGAAGSDVAREVADIVLSRDDIEGVIEAVRRGRATYANIRKVLRYLIGTGASETMVMLGAAIAGWPAPFSPIQLLWLNLITDAIPGLALGLEPPEPEVLRDRPRDSRAPILARHDFRRILREGTILGTAGFAAYLSAGGASGQPAVAARAGTITFHGLIAAQLLHAFSCRSEAHGMSTEFERPLNAKLYGAVGGGLALQALAQTVPPLRRLLRLSPIGPGGLAVVLATALWPIAANEIVTAALRRADGLPAF